MLVPPPSRSIRINRDVKPLVLRSATNRHCTRLVKPGQAVQQNPEPQRGSRIPNAHPLLIHGSSSPRVAQSASLLHSGHCCTPAYPACTRLSPPRIAQTRQPPPQLHPGVRKQLLLAHPIAHELLLRKRAPLAPNLALVVVDVQCFGAKQSAGFLSGRAEAEDAAGEAAALPWLRDSSWTARLSVEALLGASWVKGQSEGKLPLPAASGC
ncbi:hypothetical protein SVAN01_02408 [Stagonosporopsis vannaccii]|nr:hypothetical protein SVAN01_02408 [Stagonosporopsis vannaccii]